MPPLEIVGNVIVQQEPVIFVAAPPPAASANSSDQLSFSEVLSKNLNSITELERAPINPASIKPFGSDPLENSPDTAQEVLAILMGMVASGMAGNFVTPAGGVDALVGQQGESRQTVAGQLVETIETGSVPSSEAFDIVADSDFPMPAASRGLIIPQEISTNDMAIPLTLAVTTPAVAAEVGAPLPVPQGLESHHQAVARQMPGVPAQAPIVTNLLPTVVASGEVVIEVPEPVGAVQVDVGLPSMQVGDRPGVAGDRLAAAAELGARLVMLSASHNSVFVQTVRDLMPNSQATLEPTVSGAIPSGNDPGTAATVPSSGTYPPPMPIVPPEIHTGLSFSAAPLSGSAGSVPLVAGGEMAAWAKEITNQTLEHIHAHLRQNSREGATEFVLQLHPPELGQLRIHLTTQGGEVHGHIYTSDEALRRLLQEQLPELRQRLEGMGLTLGEWAVASDARDQSQREYLAAGPQHDELEEWSVGSGRWRGSRTNVPVPTLGSIVGTKTDGSEEGVNYLA